MTDQEEWRDVPGWEGYYQASSLGRVRSIDRTIPHKQRGTAFVRGVVLRPATDKQGYRRVALTRNGKGTGGNLVHRLIGKTFLPNPDNLPEINHKNAVKHDNRPTNLEWCTPLQNRRHQHSLGLSRGVVGEKHHKAKLTELDVIYIRGMYARRILTVPEMCEMFGVGETVVYYAIQRKTWRHVA